MKTPKFKILTALTLSFSLFFLNSCKKENVTPVKTVVKSDNIFAGNSVQAVNTSFDETLKIMESINSGNFNYKTSDVNNITGCATITIDSVSMPHTCTVDFGTGCVGNDGKLRSGSIYIEYNNNKLGKAGSYANVTFNTYAVDTNTMNGTFNITNNGANGSGNLVFTLNVNLTDENTASGVTVNVHAGVDIEWTQGAGTYTHEDDLFAMTGTISGTTPSGHSLSIDIIDPLIKSRAQGCNEYFIQGQMKIQEVSQPDRYLDFGSMECDDLAIETVNGTSQVVHLQGYFN